MSNNVEQACNFLSTLACAGFHEMKEYKGILQDPYWSLRVKAIAFAAMDRIVKNEEGRVFYSMNFYELAAHAESYLRCNIIFYMAFDSIGIVSIDS